MCTTNIYAAEPKDISARGAVLMDMETGRVLWERNSQEPMAVASTTKIMTALVAIESCNLDETVTISNNAASAPQVKLGLKEGEEYKLYDLLYPLMLESSNDAAVAIAEHVGGSVEGFAKMMNEKAENIGAVSTVFVTPNGLDKDGNHSTAYDMALITCEALKNKKFADLINTSSHTFCCKTSDRQFTVNNKNRLLREYQGAIGVKTGFTGLAGQCFVGAAKRNDKTLISVVLASGWGINGKEKKWTDTKKLLNYGFENFSMQKVLDKDKLYGKTIVLHSEEGEIKAVTKEDGYAMITAEEQNGIRVKAKVKESVEAPVLKGDTLGEIWVETDIGEEIFRTELVAEKDVKRKTLKSSAEKLINNWLNVEFKGIIDLNK